jgi:hypothetical protein
VPSKRKTVRWKAPPRSDDCAQRNETVCSWRVHTTVSRHHTADETLSASDSSQLRGRRCLRVSDFRTSIPPRTGWVSIAQFPALGSLLVLCIFEHFQAKGGKRFALSLQGSSRSSSGRLSPRALQRMLSKMIRQWRRTCVDGGAVCSELMFPMILIIRAGAFLYRLAWVVSGLLRFACPAAIFGYSAFAAQLTNIDNTITTGSSCMAIGCSSWLAGRAMGYFLNRI